jgi:hypothetical protein
MIAQKAWIDVAVLIATTMVGLALAFRLPLYLQMHPPIFLYRAMDTIGSSSIGLLEVALVIARLSLGQSSMA